MTTLGIKCLKASLIFFGITITVGAVYSLRPIRDIVMMSTYLIDFHSHLSMIGWVSIAILGLIYCYMENRGIHYNEGRGHKGFLFLVAGSFLMPIMLFITGVIHVFAIMNNVSPVKDRDPIIGLLMIAAIITSIGAYMSIYNVYDALDKVKSDKI